LTAEAIHRHGALAGMELWYGGTGTTAYLTRMPSLGVTSQPLYWNNPLQTRAMDRRDIGEFRRWHRDAAKRARHDGTSDQKRRARHDRRGAPLDRRSVPAPEDRRGASR